MTTTHLRTFIEVIEIIQLIEHDCDELTKCHDKGVKYPQPIGPRGVENANRTVMTKMPKQTDSRPPCLRHGHFHARVCFKDIGTCFKYSRVFHIVYDYPKFKRDHTTVLK